ncbi:MAG: hypothetical protein Q9195_004672 [Heterodermia aff. obscurata]
MPRHAMLKARLGPTVPTNHNRLPARVQLPTITTGALTAAELGQCLQEAEQLELVVGRQGGGGAGVQLDILALPGGVADGAADAGEGLVGDGGLEGGG